MIWKAFMLWDKRSMIEILEKRRSLTLSMIRGDWAYHNMMQFPMKWIYGKSWTQFQRNLAQLPKRMSF